MSKSYDRQHGESSKAYAAFCIYRDMGAKRSIKEATQKYYDPNGDQTKPKSNTGLSNWSVKWNWVERCREFDRDEDSNRQEELRRRNSEEYAEKIEHYRSQNEAIGMAFLAVNGKSLKLIDDIITPIANKARIARERGISNALSLAEIEIGMQVPNALRALANATLAGSEIAADGLHIRGLLQEHRENGVNNSEENA